MNLHSKLLCVSASHLFLIALSMLSTDVGAQDDPLNDDADEGKVEEIVVIGSRIRRQNASSLSPIVTIDREAIAFSGQPTLEETLNQMPQVMPDFGRTSNTLGDGTAHINLRGLGAARTLVLLNGRRLAPSGVGSAVDINNLPQSLIDRIEIITGGASTVYGSDAVSGVVNFVTRDDYDGLSIDANFSITEEGDSQASDLSVAYGHNLTSGRGNVTIFANVLDREQLFAGERVFTSVRWIDDWQGNLSQGGSTRIPGLLIRTPVDLGAGAVLVMFDPDGTPREFIDPDDLYNTAPIEYLQTPLNRLAGGLMANFSLSEKLETYFELSHARNEATRHFAPVPADGTISVNLDNPLLTPETRQLLADHFTDPVDPALASFPMSKRMLGLGPRMMEHTRDYSRLIAGLRGKFVGNWDFDAWLSYTDASESQLYINDASRSRFEQGLLVDPVTEQCFDPSNGCVPVNVFGEGSISAEAADYLRISNVENTTERSQKLAALVLTGPLTEIWSGNIDAAFGIEWRSDEGHLEADEVLLSGDALGFTGPSSVNGTEKVWEAYGEAIVPLAQDFAWADYLALEVGARYSEYKNAGGDWTYKIGGEWQPFDALRFRGMYQRSVRAPNLNELFEEQSTRTGSFVGQNTSRDPCSASADPIGNEYTDKCIIQGLDASQVGTFEATSRYPTDFVRGGNPNLTPEVAKTWTIGADINLNALPNWNISIDYFNLEVTDTIGGIQASLICFDSLNTGHLFCDNIIRDSSGNVAKVVELTSNRGIFSTDGFDTQIQYQKDLPDFLAFGESFAQITMNTIWTHMLSNDMQENPATGIFQCAGSFGWPCSNNPTSVNGTTFSKNRVTTNANYVSGPISTHLTWRWIEGTDNAATIGAEAIGFPPPDLAIPDVDNKNYFDLGFAYEFNEHFLARLNINNLFDSGPPQMASASWSNNTDTGMYDIFGRSYYLSFSVHY